MKKPSFLIAMSYREDMTGNECAACATSIPRELKTQRMYRACAQYFCNWSKHRLHNSNLLWFLNRVISISKTLVYVQCLQWADLCFVLVYFMNVNCNVDVVNIDTTTKIFLLFSKKNVSFSLSVSDIPNCFKVQFLCGRLFCWYVYRCGCVCWMDALGGLKVNSNWRNCLLISFCCKEPLLKWGFLLHLHLILLFPLRKSHLNDMFSFVNPLLGPGFILHIQKLSNLFLASTEGKSFVRLFLDDYIRKWRSFDLEGTQLMFNHWLGTFVTVFSTNVSILE